jgi:hypothetical protein
LPTAEHKVVIVAHGHVNVLATHPTTLQFTKDAYLSRKGDCIIAVSADKTMSDLNPVLKESLRHERGQISIIIEAGGTAETVHARGSSRLILSHPTDFVIRKGSYICDRTLAIQADKAAGDLSRTLVEKLKDPRQEVHFTLIVTVQRTLTSRTT